jgi:MFS family permease
MRKYLDLFQGYRYSLVALVFFISYFLFQFPSTAILRAAGPRRFLAGITLGWGITMLGSGFVTNWRQLLALRFVLGIFEAGSYPGSIYLISTWYTRYELQKRYAILYMMGTIATGGSGILAFGLSKIGGRAGLDGWSWIFIVEGVLTCIIAISSYWTLVDFPENAERSWSFITPEQRDLLLSRVHNDRGSEAVEPFSMKRRSSYCPRWT